MATEGGQDTGRRATAQSRPASGIGGNPSLFLSHGLKKPQAETALATPRLPSLGFSATGRWSVGDRLPGFRTHTEPLFMGKGNHSQKNDKKNKKPKQDKTKPSVKK